MRYKMSTIPILLGAVSILLMITAVGWAFATGVCVPDQDPTPAMQARFRFHSRIVDHLLLAGMGTLAVGVISLLVNFVRARIARRPAA